ncbi:MAG TPA: trypsin-like peptidase domain-containing protein [Bryobacteraceae bacterium]|nr:trypsin-like peptidase domain-containing protein [Bryobacteraceae bacterium]
MRGFGEIAERLRRSTVQVFADQRRGGGSGVIWKPDGLIITNAHVARQRQLQVELWDGRRFEGRVLSQDPRRDLAMIRLAAPPSESDLPAATPGDSGALRPGELVIAVGSPLGFSGAVSTGVVHSLGALPGMGRQNWIRADVRLAPGNSGGPLADAQGRVIGINTAIVNGLGVAVPGDAVKAFLQKGARPSLGVTLQPVSYGLLILDLDPQGAAAAASLRAGDILIGSFDSLSDALDSGRDVIRLQFFRGDRTKVREAFVRLAAHAVAA